MPVHHPLKPFSFRLIPTALVSVHYLSSSTSFQPIPIISGKFESFGSQLLLLQDLWIPESAHLSPQLSTSKRLHCRFVKYPWFVFSSFLLKFLLYPVILSLRIGPKLFPMSPFFYSLVKSIYHHLVFISFENIHSSHR